MDPPPGTDDFTPEADTLGLAEHNWVEFLRLGDPEGPLGIRTWRCTTSEQTSYLLRVEERTYISSFLQVDTLPELMDLLARWAPAVQAAAVADALSCINMEGLSDKGFTERLGAKLAYGQTLAGQMREGAQ